jgi:glyoxylase-like metal-dependent hydrolase (beta-lactamase superfamily II)
MSDAAGPGIRAFFDDATNTVTYLVWDPATLHAAIIDPVLDWDNRSGEADTKSADQVLAAARDLGLTVEWVLETHVHADHLTASPYIKARTNTARIGIGEGIRQVQQIFRPAFNAEDLKPEGGDFDHLFHDAEEFTIGALPVRVLHVPGHTPACVAYVVDGKAAFVGDTIFMPDYGTARCDFPGGSAHTLWGSIRKLLSLPPETRIFVGHDYKAPGRDQYAWESTVADQRAHNPHVKDGTTESQFVEMREARDAKLAPPLLLLPSIQVNMRAGRFPPAESNGVRYLKIPLKMKGGAGALP